MLISDEKELVYIVNIINIGYLQNEWENWWKRTIIVYIISNIYPNLLQRFFSKFSPPSYFLKFHTFTHVYLPLHLYLLQYTCVTISLSVSLSVRRSFCLFCFHASNPFCFMYLNIRDFSLFHFTIYIPMSDIFLQFYLTAKMKCTKMSD